VIVPYLGDDRRGDWAAFGRQLNGIGRPIKDAGLQLAYHNHDFEFVNNGLETLYASSDPELVKAELDVAWVAIGGGDPVQWVRNMGSRAPLIHLKDYDPSKNPQWQPGGQGLIDWTGVLAACKDTGAEFGVVELDLYAGDPLDAARMSYEFFKSKGLS
jgi:sugar phosphate isomerase/epimerase